MTVTRSDNLMPSTVKRFDRSHRNGGNVGDHEEHGHEGAQTRPGYSTLTKYGALFVGAVDIDFCRGVDDVVADDETLYDMSWRDRAAR